MKSKTPAAERPFVFLNLAMTADGKIATANRAVHAFGSPRDLAHLYELRATADAILCGARTVESSQTLLGNGGEKYRRQRLRRGLSEYPLRLIASGSGSLDPAAKIFQKQFSPVIVLATEKIPVKKLRQLRPLADEVKICGATEINFPAVLRWLRTRWHVRRLLCEGGGDLNDALFRARLVDEIHLTLCPKIVGGRHAPTLAEGRGFPQLAGAENFQIHSLRQVQDELFLILARK